MRNFLTYNESEQELRPQWGLYGGSFGGGIDFDGVEAASAQRICRRRARDAGAGRIRRAAEFLCRVLDGHQSQNRRKEEGVKKIEKIPAVGWKFSQFPHSGTYPMANRAIHVNYLIGGRSRVDTRQGIAPSRFGIRPRFMLHLPPLSHRRLISGRLADELRRLPLRG